MHNSIAGTSEGTKHYVERTENDFDKTFLASLTNQSQADRLCSAAKQLEMFMND